MRDALFGVLREFRIRKALDDLFQSGARGVHILAILELPICKLVKGRSDAVRIVARLGAQFSNRDLRASQIIQVLRLHFGEQALAGEVVWKFHQLFFDVVDRLLELPTLDFVLGHGIERLRLDFFVSAVKSRS